MNPLAQKARARGDNVGDPTGARESVDGPIVVMGPSGSGKTTIGRRLAEALGRPFLDADDHHSATNVAKMQAGLGLTDEDREPWLRELQQILAREPRAVLACSALKRSYRTLLRPDTVRVAFLLLDVPEAELARRLKARTGHYAGPSLLASQLATLEAPTEELNSFVIDGRGPEEVVLGRALAALCCESSPNPR